MARLLIAAAALLALAIAFAAWTGHDPEVADAVARAAERDARPAEHGGPGPLEEADAPTVAREELAAAAPEAPGAVVGEPVIVHVSTDAALRVPHGHPVTLVLPGAFSGAGGDRVLARGQTDRRGLGILELPAEPALSAGQRARMLVRVPLPGLLASDSAIGWSDEGGSVAGKATIAPVRGFRVRVRAIDSAGRGVVDASFSTTGEGAAAAADAIGSPLLRKLGPGLVEALVIDGEEGWIEASHGATGRARVSCGELRALGPSPWPWDLRLEPRARLRGTLVGADGAPLAGVRLAFDAEASPGRSPEQWGATRHRCTTDGEGRFDVLGLAEARFAVIPEGEGEPVQRLDASADPEDVVVRWDRVWVEWTLPRAADPEVKRTRCFVGEPRPADAKAGERGRGQGAGEVIEVWVHPVGEGLHRLLRRPGETIQVRVVEGAAGGRFRQVRHDLIVPLDGSSARFEVPRPGASVPWQTPVHSPMGRSSWHGGGR